jgi:Ribosomal protein L11 methyltransferase (PrmA)
MDSNDLLPPGLTVHGDPGDIAVHFAAVALLQPVRTVADGVVCAPRAAPDLARRGRAVCRLPMSPLPDPPGWPDPPSLTAGSWFIRSRSHITAPIGFRELVQVPGEGFGSWPHPTTLLCLRALDLLPMGTAIDLGCGSGLLSQAWAATHGAVMAVDIDHRAVTHTAASLAHAHPVHRVELRQAPIACVLPDVTHPILLANVPPVVHQEIARTMPHAARMLLVSGIRIRDAGPTLTRYRALSFAVSAVTEASGWGCWLMVRD